MIKTTICWVAGLALGLVSQVTVADTITGELTFVKKASFAGVVYMESVDGVEASSIEGASVDQVDKMFTKKIVVAGKGGDISFRNSDSIDHNIFSNDSDSGVKFDVGLMTPAGQKSVDVTWDENLLVRYGCKIHPKMKSYIFTSPTPYFQVLEFEKKVPRYTFVLGDVPSGLTRVSLTIPKYDTVTIELSVGESKQADVIRKGKKKAVLQVSRAQ
ncbi:hypothetical protein A9Q99_08040 [Gammaproteobacteria bacterium 45_16_T64]|nr:hypothetical protein A9Q99_08040 [Gammaproteobacteria bacterium 45_16_T64]